MENIIENNKLIAQFMGGKLNDELSFLIAQNDIFIPYHGVIRLDTVETGKGPVIKYHKSWDWLMPVVEKIENIDFGNWEPIKGDVYMNCSFEIEITSSVCQLNIHADQRCYKSFFYVCSNSKIESVYGLIIEFIKWYNNL